VGLVSVANLPLALRIYSVPAAGAGALGTNTAFNNAFYGESTNVWFAGGLGAVFGGLGPRFGARVESSLAPYITNVPRIPITGPAYIPSESTRLLSVPSHLGSLVGNTVSNVPSFIPLDNGKQPTGTKP